MKRRFSSDEIRDTFLRFFTERQHARIEAASLIPANDPTLLFINAGMAPLKPYFLGEAIPPAPDLCNVQPCVRTIDIGDVGDRHHLTFFEMLGSWSIDHYFKERAVELAFELLTRGFGFAVADLYMTVFAGDDALGVPPDDVSAAAWERAGVPRDHIVYLGAEDNFWSAGDTGPCGPCTEVFYDTGAGHGEQYRPGGEFDSAGRYIEIWNAGVFMEFNRLPGGTLEPLRFTSVDTGSGLERMAMVLQDRDSAYETDLFAPVVAAVESALGGSGAAQRDIRIVADHVRASAFILSEGVVPSNEGRGYIPRRLLRKVVAIATQAGAGDFDVRDVAATVIDRMHGCYPQLTADRDRIMDLLAREQRDFGRVVRRGLDRLAALDTGPGFEITGDEAFTLFATHGMPVDLIRDFAAERGGRLDEPRFAELFAGHRQLSRAAGPARDGQDGHAAADPDVIAALGATRTRFLGHQVLAATGQVTALAGRDGPVGSLTAGDTGLAVFDQTPCYAEGGGQVGDTGQITAAGLSARVTDTQNAGGHHLHHIEVTEGVLSVGDTVELAVDAERRRSIMRNHSATHLLHAALRRVLGEHVRQAGSLVAPDRLRFDFLHPRALSDDETEQVERLVNAEVLANAERTTVVKPYQAAIRDGAIAFFGEKYGDDVRVVSFDGFSTELCGGTHVHGTAEVGLFLIVSEGSIGSGTRRIEAITGNAAVRRTLERDKLLRQLAARLRVSVDQLPARVEALAARPGRARQPRLGAEALAGAVRADRSGHRYLVASDPGLGPSDLPAQARQLSSGLDAVVVLLLPAAEDGFLRVGVSVPATLTAKTPATEVLDRVLAVTGGRGGGSDRFAQGGGTNRDDLSGIESRIWAALGSDLSPSALCPIPLPAPVHPAWRQRTMRSASCGGQPRRTRLATWCQSTWSAAASASGTGIPRRLSCSARQLCTRRPSGSMASWRIIVAVLFIVCSLDSARARGQMVAGPSWLGCPVTGRTPGASRLGPPGR
jgi:alanyl-tRNA synthetase